MKYCVLLILLGSLFCAQIPAHCLAQESGVVITEYKVLADDGVMYDKFGQSAAISGDFAIVGAQGVRDVVSPENTLFGAAYILHNDGTDWIQTQKLTSGNMDLMEKFGHSVAIWGGYAIVGAPEANDNGEASGAAYIFHYDNSSWVPVQKIVAGDGASGDAFGFSVSMSGDYAFVGAPGCNHSGDHSGAVYVFHNTDGIWTELTPKLTAGANAGWSKFGHSVAVSGLDAIVGAPGTTGERLDGGTLIELPLAGSVYIYHFDTGQAGWLQTQQLDAGADGDGWDNFGQSVAISGNEALVGAPGDDQLGSSSGSVYVFSYDQGSWLQTQRLNATDGEPADYFGQSVTFSGSYMVIGASGDDDSGLLAGSAYIFHNDLTSWSEVSKLNADDGATSDYFGQSVAMSPNYAIIGGYGKDQSAGSVYIYGSFSQDSPADPTADINDDGDVDGLDLATYIEQLSDVQISKVSISDLAAAFGQ